ncbi:MAG: THUMP domain-containing protein [bacterium]|nr:THUMP domain-containing protein [bacterium]
MKYIAICPKGLEDITQKEIKEILDVLSKVVLPGRVLFSTSSLAKLLKKTQSIIKVYSLQQECSDLKEIKVFSVITPFRVVCSRFGEQSFNSQDVEKIIGEKFHKGGNSVDLKNPKSIVFIDIIDEKIFVGVDQTPELLSKRKYRVKIHNQSLNACIAYGLVRLSGYNAKKILLDPFCRDGIISIEALIYKKGKVIAYDSLFPNVRSTEINATLAKVRKDLQVSRIETEWLDTKFGEEEVDCVVTAVPFVSKTLRENEVKNLYKDFFYHVSFILKKKGRVVCIAPHLVLFKSMCEGLEIVEEREVSTNNLSYSVVVFKK